MNKEEKLAYHLEMIIWEDISEGERLNAMQIAAKVVCATDEQKKRAYQRALVKSPILLDDEK